MKIGTDVLRVIPLLAISKEKNIDDVLGLFPEIKQQSKKRIFLVDDEIYNL